MLAAAVPLAVARQQRIALCAEGKDAIACFAPTSESQPSDQDALVEALFEGLFAGGAPTLGQAIMQAKRNLPQGGCGYEDLVETYSLLCDPATRFEFWPKQNG